MLLLEAGEDVGSSVEYRVPAMHALSTEDPDLAWWYFVGHHAQAGLDELDSKWTPDGILYPRGSALGGSTAVNALVTVLPSRSDWNRLAEMTGDASWRADAMDAYYDRVREWLDVELPDPSLATDDQTVVDSLISAANAQAEAPDDAALDPSAAVGSLGELTRLLQHDLNDALRRGETTGLFRLPLATSAGRRNGTREFVLDTVDAGFPLTVVTGALVTRVVWDDDAPVATAIGVEYVRGRGVYAANLQPGDPPGAPEVVLADREVILSAGAFNSPQLLLLSGVGDADQLDDHGIEVQVDLPGVGRNLQDRYEISVVSEFSQPLALVEACELGRSVEDDPCLQDWARGVGVYRTTGFLATVLRRSSPEVPLADLQVFAAPGDARGYYPGYSDDALASPQRFSWLVLKGHTANRDGTVRLADADPFSRPLIRFDYFDESDPLSDPDLLAMVAGVRFVRDIGRRMRGLRPAEYIEEIWPGPELDTDEELAEWIRRETWGHHASCSNKMGPADDPMAVVDANFRVHGVEGLRVVDASVFPEIPGTFIALPTFMISEKAADVILEAHP